MGETLCPRQAEECCGVSFLIFCKARLWLIRWISKFLIVRCKHLPKKRGMFEQADIDWGFKKPDLASASR